jgi:general stress protein 26
MQPKTTKEFRDDLEKFDTAMLVTRDGEYLRARPMRPHIGREDGSIRFLSSVRTHKVDEIGENPDANIVFTDDDAVWISVSGRVRFSREKIDIDELWSAGADAWIDKKDAVVLVVQPEIAEYWDNRENAVKAAWEVTKGALTGERPDIGEHRKMTL